MTNEQTPAAPVIPGSTWVGLRSGGRVCLRLARAKRALAFSEMLIAAEGGDDQDAANKALSEHAMLIARWGIVGAQGVLDENGDEVAFSREMDDAHPDLGPIATRGFVGEALTLADLNDLPARIISGNLVTESVGKS